MTEPTFTPEQHALRRTQTISLLRMDDDWVPGPSLPRLYRNADPVALAGDAYVEDRTSAFAARSGDDRHAATHRRDAELANLARARLHEEGIYDLATARRDLTDDERALLRSEREPWEAAKAQLERQGSFRELRQAMALLKREDLYSWTCLIVVYGWEAEWREPGVLVVRAADVAVEYVEARMPDPIRVPPSPTWLEQARSWWALRDKRGEDARARRDAEMRSLAYVGVSKKELEARFGLSQSQVSKIVNGLARHVATGAA